MEVVTGMIGWTPQAFWSSTVKEVMAAHDGFVEFNTVSKDERPLDDDGNPLPGGKPAKFFKDLAAKAKQYEETGTWQ